MAQPTPYSRQSDFSDWSQNNPELPHDGVALDSEYNAIKTTLDQTLENLARLQRDDGELANQTVGAAQLKADLLALFGVATAWKTGTAYALEDMVFYNSAIYECATAHTSGTFAADLAAAKWDLLIDFGGDQFQSTSTTSLLIGTGSKAFTILADKAFTVGSFVLAVSQSGPTNYMHGQVTAYIGTTLTVNVLTTGGSGTKADWLITLSGPTGPTGPSGADGASGNNLLKVSTDDTTPGFAEDKIIVGAQLALTTNNPGANETRQISLSDNARNTIYLYLNDNFR